MESSPVRLDAKLELATNTVAVRAGLATRSTARRLPKAARAALAHLGSGGAAPQPRQPPTRRGLGVVPRRPAHGAHRQPERDHPEQQRQHRRRHPHQARHGAARRRHDRAGCSRRGRSARAATSRGGRALRRASCRALSTRLRRERCPVCSPPAATTGGSQPAAGAGPGQPPGPLSTSVSTAAATPSTVSAEVVGCTHRAHLSPILFGGGGDGGSTRATPPPGGGPG